ncbi:unnamed protein product, partial [Phaeothamnion confervicola]
LDNIDAVTVADVTKVWLRSLSPRLVTPELYLVAVNAGRNRDVIAARRVLDALPPPHRATLVFLLEFLRRAAEHEEMTRMGAAAFSRVVSPNVLVNPGNDPVVFRDNAGHESAFVQLLIEATHSFAG